MRDGPGGQVVARINNARTQAVLGADATGDWLFFRAGWLPRDALELSGNCGNLPQLDPAKVGSGTIDFCPPGYDGYLPPRIGVGEANTRVVSGAIANRLRAAPEVTAEQIGEIPPGALIDAVLDGPACNLAFVWWQVEVDGLVGWTVESDLNAYHYYLEPMPTPAVDSRRAPEIGATQDFDQAQTRPARMIHSANASDIAAVKRLPIASPRALAWSPTGRFLAALAGDGLVTVYHVPDFVAIEPELFASDADPARAIAFHPTEQVLALGGDAGRVTLLALRADSAIASQRHLGGLSGPVTGLAWSATGGKLAAISGDERLKLARQSGTLKTWDFSDDEPARVHMHYSFPYPLTAVAFSRDGRWLAVSGESISDRRAALWIYDSHSGDLIFSKPLIPMRGAGLIEPAPDAALGDFIYSSGDSLYQIMVATGEDLRIYHQAGAVFDGLSIRPASDARRGRPCWRWRCAIGAARRACASPMR